MQRWFPKLFLFLALSTTCFGQDSAIAIKELRKSLDTASTYMSEFELYRSLGEEYYKTQLHYDSAFYYAKEAYDIARSNKYREGEARALFSQAAIYRQVGDLDNALKVYEESLTIARAEMRKNPEIVRLPVAIINNIGDIYVQKEAYSKAQENYLDALELAIANNIPDIEALEYLNLGEIYYYQGNYIASKKSIQKSYATRSSFIGQIPDYYRLLARTCFSLQEIKEAEEAGLQGLHLAKERKDISSGKQLALLLAKIYQQKEELRSFQMQSLQTKIIDLPDEVQASDQILIQKNRLFVRTEDEVKFYSY